jgi:hypothetical protein
MSENTAVESLLGATARWRAAVWAMESAQEDRLLDDPRATSLAGEVGQHRERHNPQEVSCHLLEVVGRSGM